VGIIFPYVRLPLLLRWPSAQPAIYSHNTRSRTFRVCYGVGGSPRGCVEVRPQLAKEAQPRRKRCQGQSFPCSNTSSASSKASSATSSPEALSTLPRGHGGTWSPLDRADRHRVACNHRHCVAHLEGQRRERTPPRSA